MSTQAFVLERIVRTAPFGVRFWDVVLERQVSELLEVVLVPAGGSHRRIAAKRNHGGVYVAQDLPGLREAEFSDFESPVEERDFRVEVTDLSGRFHDLSFDARLPHMGLFEGFCGSPPSPPDDRLDVVPLFSLPSRPVPPGFAVVRSRLVREDGSAATLAALEVVPASGARPVRGYADDRGEVAVVFGYPEPAGSVESPPFPPAGKLWEQSWDVEVSASLPALEPAAEHPDLCAFALRRPATPFAGAAPLPTPQPLRFGRDLVLPELVVVPAASPP